ncbi:MAG: TonB-dependent receptor [Parvularculaceae bacterium]|nr:TonB-dependent receptor [Parvularculaceae bacterium]
MHRRLFTSVCSTAFVLTAPAAALAQDQADAQGRDEIVVTAQFREQNILEVPLAVTAYDQEFLDRARINGFAELSAFVPGFVVQEQSVNNPGFVLRGITSDDGAATIEPRVSVFQNGISIARPRGSAVPLYDLERVEVLKGPQGTLFGRSAQIGAVHVITRRPDYEFGGLFGAEFGNFDQQRYDAALNIPLIEDKLALRFAGQYERRNGFIDNPLERDLNGADTLSLRGSLRFEPTEAVRLDIIGHYTRDEPPGTSFKSGVIPALGGSTDPNDFATLSTFGGFLGGAPLGVERDLHDVTAILDIKISDALSITSTTGYRSFDSLEVFDPDGSAFNIFAFAEDANSRQISSDIRFNYDNDGRFTGFFGGGVFFEEGEQRVPLGFGVGETAALFGSLAAVGPMVDGRAPFGGSVPLAGAFLSGNPAVLNATLGFAGIPVGVFQEETFANASDNVSFDAFAEISYEVTDRLTFTAGGRFTYDDKESLFEGVISQPNPLTPFIVGAPALLVGNSGGFISSDDQAGLDSTFSGFAWRAVLNYEIADGKFVYFNHSRGRRPQVIEDAFATTPAGAAVGQFNVIPAETVSSYEIGAKGAFFDDRLTIETAGYLYNYTNFQTTVRIDGGPGVPPTFPTVNGGSADALGAELGLSARPVEGLDLFLTYGYNRARFDETDADGNPQLFGGNQFRLAPDHSLSAGFNYEKQTSVGAFFLTPSFTWRSRVFFENENDGAIAVFDPVTLATVFTVPAVAQEAYGLFNVRAGLRIDDRFEVYGYAENLLDKEYIIDAGNTGGGFGIPTFIAGAPRFWGGGFRVTF